MAGGGNGVAQLQALQGITQLWTQVEASQVAGPPASNVTLDSLAVDVMKGLLPQNTIVPRTQALVPLPGGMNWPPANTGAAQLNPLTVAPSFPIPMGRYLAEVSQDFLLPGVGNIPVNSISLLEPDQRAIESFLVGVNQEALRLLRWYNLPIKESVTFFQQFWDATAAIAAELASIPTGTTPDLAAIYSSFFDIDGIENWDLGSALGANQNPTGSNPPHLFLLLRGDLLHQYPNVHVYALPAMPNPTPAPGLPELVVDPSKAVIQPLFRNQLPPDLTFYAWPFKGADAVGTGDTANYPHGIFFVFQEVPGELGFGLEPANAALGVQVDKWGVVSWGNLPAGTKFLSPSLIPTVDPTASPTVSIKPQLTPDTDILWNSDAASMAYILLRHPAWVAFHASSMVPSNPASPPPGPTTGT
ncbi:MAG: hypothetical protein L3K15_03665 [Thermoplasmata archaeon]|nr:hypothetical protein [Thermoplasmata archaeon]